jgi:L-ascorbate metabolism protein UlaG (beta-lactamase superfamily)
MIVQKFYHSCILLEENGRRLLFDPGTFSFMDTLRPEDIGVVDVIILTHQHQDHYFPEALKKIISLGKTTIFTHEERL